MPFYNAAAETEKINDQEITLINSYQILLVITTMSKEHSPSFRLNKFINKCEKKHVNKCVDEINCMIKKRSRF